MLNISSKRCGQQIINQQGRQKGKQDIDVKDVNYIFVEGDARKGKYEEEKKEAIKLYTEGMGFRSIGRVIGISNVSVLRWIKAAGERIKRIMREIKN